MNSKNMNTSEARKAIAEANTFFYAERENWKKGLLVLAHARLLSEAPAQIEENFREVDRDPDDKSALQEVLRELCTSGGAEVGEVNPSGPAHHEIHVSQLRAMERCGELYPDTVEVVFPPQVVAKYGMNGLVLPVRDVLHQVAARIAVDHPRRAGIYAEIAETYYLEDEEDDHLNDDLETLA